MNRIVPSDDCPCRSGLSYQMCCQPLHKGGKASSPTALMRSRYCAYALNLADYIMKTTHPDGMHFQTDKTAWKREIELFSTTTTFAHLQILSAADDKVVFRATLFVNTRDASFTEVSTFRQQNGHWKYYSGVPLEH